MNYLDRVIQIMESYSYLGERVLDNGTRLIGHVPHVAPEAWLHSVFAPITDVDVNGIEAVVKGPLPPVFLSFLQRCNGLHFFSGSLSIDGLRMSYARTGDAAWQPYDIRTPNVEERPRLSKPAFFFIGGYRWDGSLLYIDDSDQEVYRCSNRSAKPLNRWPNFEVMLESEVKRLSEFFDREGRQIDPERPTTP